MTVRLPQCPEVRPNFRDPAHVKPVMLRMGLEFIEALDRLCESNGRSRREIVEILVSEAFVELQEDPGARIQPL